MKTEDGRGCFWLVEHEKHGYGWQCLIMHFLLDPDKLKAFAEILNEGTNELG